MLPAQDTAPVVQVSRRAAERLRAGHLWVYRSDIDMLPALEPAPGALVTVQDGRGSTFGTGLWSSSSQIAVRLVSRGNGLTREHFLAELRERLRSAVRLRRELSPVTATNNAHRLVFSEADGLPGIIADRYNDLVLLQLLVQGTAQDDVRAVVRDVLAEELSPRGEPLIVWERTDGRTGQLEQLAPAPAGVLFSTEEHPPTTTTVCLNGLRFGYDAGAGQKTGAFLDQRLNYAAAAGWAERLLRANGRPGRALDVCTYHGGFALHLARVCERVTGVDASRAALEQADRNRALNASSLHSGGSGVHWVEADAFDLLRAMDEAHGAQERGSAGAHPATTVRGARRSANHTLPEGLGGRFDVIVLDPPAFAKTKRAVDGALRGYKELNLRALRLLAPGGLLVTCSCSHHVRAEDFREAVRAAAVDAGREVQVLEERGAAPDHPEVLALPETRYLKCLLCRVG